MKIQCDACSKESASFFCPADDAALCAACDHHVHQVNKLAGKHQRFSLTIPSSSDQQIPLCDICQENRAFLFCQQDRAILCRGCDYSIHNANKNTRNHSRFLLTGTKLSLHTSSAASVQVKPMPAPPSADPSIGGATTTSSISEYLIETLPGWRVDDFLDSNAHTFDLSKGVEEEELVLMSVWESEFRGKLSPTIISDNSSVSTFDGGSYTFITSPKKAVINGEFAVKYSNGDFSRWTEEEEDRSFTVPQILNNSNSSKRSRFA